MAMVCQGLGQGQGASTVKGHKAGPLPGTLCLTFS